MELETTMHKDLLTDFLQLYHGLGASRARLANLLKRFAGNPRNILQGDAATLRANGLRQTAILGIRACQAVCVDADLAWAQRDGNHLLCYDDDAYPALLREIPDFPVLLYASGNLDLLRRPQIAIVGSRNCTPGGAQNAFDFAAQCAASGLVVTSGLALGIDAAAHQGALSIDGDTIAVTATGLDLVYPPRNRKLAASIVERGLVISEFPLGSPARRAHFPQRNRIISGLAIATLVVEAAQRSGSLITARLAAEQGREVFAIPGSIHNPQTRGCHQLIRDGATLVETTRDIAGELGSLFDFARQQQSSARAEGEIALDDEQRALLDSIGYDPVNCDILVQRSGLTIDKLSSMLVTLELNDLIQSAPGGCFVRI
jgi:DNA processing protein